MLTESVGLDFEYHRMSSSTSMTVTRSTVSGVQPSRKAMKSSSTLLTESPDAAPSTMSFIRSSAMRTADPSSSQRQTPRSMTRLQRKSRMQVSRESISGQFSHVRPSTASVQSVTEGTWQTTAPSISVRQSVPSPPSQSDSPVPSLP